MKNIRELFFFIFANLAHTNFISMQKWLALSLFTISSFAQSHKIVVVDGETGIPIEKCFIESDKGKGFYTDAKGKITLPKNIDQISIAHLGYESWSGTLTDTIFLKPDIISLEGVTVNLPPAKKEIIRIMPVRSMNNLMPHNVGDGTLIAFNEQKGIFVPNENPDKQKLLKKILLRPTGYSKLDLSNGKLAEFEQAKYSSFKVNLWSVMPDVGVPLRPLMESDVVVQLKKGETYVQISLPEEILLPKDGIFIVLSSLTQEYYNKEDSKVPTAPAFYRIGVSKKSKFKMFVRTVDEDGYGLWKRDDWYWKHNSVYLAGFEAEVIH